MEFWGMDIRSGETVVVEKKGNTLLHLSQAFLVEGKKNKDTELVYLFAKVGGQKFVIGVISPEKNPRVSFDLVFEKPFELSHTSKYGSIHMLGYRGSEEDAEEPDSEQVPALNIQGTKVKDESEDDDSVDESSDDEKVVKDEKESSDDELESDDEDSDDSEEEKEEVDKQKAETSKKRPAETATKTPSADKKAKLVTPEKSASKTGGNKVVHVATPYPKKPTSAFECKPCKKSFGSDVALQSHTKAKHGSGN